jgi:DNA-binding response OmpR family regulator
MDILVVDDHQELLEFVGEGLRREGYTVAGADSLQAARRSLGARPFDLVVLDLGLSDGSGLELCRELRSLRQTMPILMLTAQSAVSARVECLDAGADDYLTKPFALAELRARIRALLRRTEPAVTSVTVSGGARLDFRQRRATVNSAPSPITAREWAILETLAAANGGPVSRHALLTRVWPDDAGDKVASLEVLLSRIRHKLGSDAVRTLRGVGYALAIGDETANR